MLGQVIDEGLASIDVTTGQEVACFTYTWNTSQLVQISPTHELLIAASLGRTNVGRGPLTRQ